MADLIELFQEVPEAMAHQLEAIAATMQRLQNDLADWLGRNQ